MKHKGFLLALVLLLSTVSASAQSEGSQPELPTRIAVARCAYSQADDMCVAAADRTANVDTAGTGPQRGRTPRRFPGPQAHPTGSQAYPRRGYSPAWVDTGTVRHTAIGMAIGFGLGAAFGAKVNNDRTPGTEARASLAFGAIGAMLGAVVGAGVPSFDARNRHRHGPWPPAEDEEDQLAARSEPRSAEPQGEQNEASKSARLSDPSPELTVP